jgi:putative pre-16S rRNA nuclease
MRVLGVDVGRRRIGLALSDESATLARPWKTVAARDSTAATARDLAARMTEAAGDDAVGPVAAIVVGLPRRLGGEDTDMTATARDLATRLGELTGLPVHLQDERLTSYEADQRLAVGERDWRRRKARLDAAAAAIILQDFLDARARPTPVPADVRPRRPS